jgi:hypothetical protein
MNLVSSSYFVECIQLFAYELKDVDLHDIFLDIKLPIFLTNY